MVRHHLRCGHAVRLGTWLPILQGIADKGVSGHPPCLKRLFFATVELRLSMMNKNSLPEEKGIAYRDSYTY